MRRPRDKVDYAFYYGTLYLFLVPFFGFGGGFSEELRVGVQEGLVRQGWDLVVEVLNEEA